MYRAKLSESYQLIVTKDLAGWSGLINGPCPIEDRRLSTEDLDDAQKEAYDLAIRHFTLKGIAELPIPCNQLQWEYCSK
jgi:hypothetical protein